MQLLLDPPTVSSQKPLINSTAAPTLLRHRQLMLDVVALHQYIFPEHVLVLIFMAKCQMKRLYVGA